VRALIIAWKDLRHTYRSPAGLAMMLVAPLLLAFVLGMAFGSGDTFSIARVKTVVVDQDRGAGAGGPAAGAMLTGVLTAPEMSDLLEVVEADTPERARELVDNGEADVAVIIPAGLSETLGAAGAAVGQASPAEVQLYRDPALTVGPAIVEAVVARVVRALDGARAAASTTAMLALSHGVSGPEDLSRLAAEAAEGFSAQAQTDPPIVMEQRAPALKAGESDQGPNVGSQVLVGMMLFFMLFGAATPARSILDEHRQGTLPRLFTTPTPRSVILGGKYLSVLLVVLAQVVVLLLAGRFLLGARWGETGPVVILTLCSAVVAASLGLVTVSFAKTPAQAGAVSSAIFVFLGLISGSFTGTIGLEGAYAVVRRVSPLGWLMEGWASLLYGGSWGDIWLPALAALGFALAFFGLATFFFRRRYT
jgi:ABC-2 type transport system permease protein